MGYLSRKAVSMKQKQPNRDTLQLLIQQEQSHIRPLKLKYKMLDIKLQNPMHYAPIPSFWDRNVHSMHCMLEVCSCLLELYRRSQLRDYLEYQEETLDLQTVGRQLRTMETQFEDEPNGF